MATLVTYQELLDMDDIAGKRFMARNSFIKIPLTTNCFDRENHNYVKTLKGYQREENMILIFKRTVQIAIKNLAVFVLLLVNISFKF